jgi:uroporphyrinogen-III synthase
MLAPLGLQTIIQPAFSYVSLDTSVFQPDIFEEMCSTTSSDLLLFTSPRSVIHGLPQIPAEILQRTRVAAIGPATASALMGAGIRVDITPGSGYTSEELLATLAAEPAGTAENPNRAYIIAAPGGRQRLAMGLHELGWHTDVVMVYRPEQAEVNKEELSRLQGATGVLSIWTSGSTMKTLSQLLPPATWYQICQGEWLVISDRLKLLARAFGPEQIHMAHGPGNEAISSAIRGLL